MAGLWQAIEALPGQTAAQLVWRRWLGEDFPVASSLLLRRTGAIASQVPCWEGCGGLHRVVSHTDGTFLAVCEEEGADCDDRQVSRGDLEIFKISFLVLARVVAKAFGLSYRDGDVGFPSTRQIASFGGVGMPIILTVQEDRHAMQAVVARLVATLPKYFVVLAPTDEHLDIEAKRLLKSASACFFALSQTLLLDTDRGLHAPKLGAELFSPVLPEQQDQLTKTDIERMGAIYLGLRSPSRLRKARLEDVFYYVVIQGISQRRAAALCEPRCSTSLVSERIGEIERRFQMPLKALQSLFLNSPELRDVVKGARRGRDFSEGFKTGSHSPAPSDASEDSDADY